MSTAERPQCTMLKQHLIGYRYMPSRCLSFRSSFNRLQTTDSTQCAAFSKPVACVLHNNYFIQSNITLQADRPHLSASATIIIGVSISPLQLTIKLSTVKSIDQFIQLSYQCTNFSTLISISIILHSYILYTFLCSQSPYQFLDHFTSVYHFLRLSVSPAVNHVNLSTVLSVYQFLHIYQCINFSVALIII